MINYTMKKFVLALAITFSVSMISCTNNNAEQVEVTEDTTAVVEEVVDSTAAVVDSAAVVEFPPSDTIILH